MPDEAPQREPNSCFVIMPIGRADTDLVWTEVYEPTIKACGLDPKRIDKQAKGGLVTPEIIHLIQTSHLIVADLTFARPNCYYELGFAHAVNLSAVSRVLLCCRRRTKIHFDLNNHDVLFWKQAELDKFKAGLRGKIEYRLGLIRRDEDAEREAKQKVVDLVSKDLRASLEERLKLLTQRERERLAGTWKRDA